MRRPHTPAVKSVSRSLGPRRTQHTASVHDAVLVLLDDPAGVSERSAVGSEGHHVTRDVDANRSPKAVQIEQDRPVVILLGHVAVEIGLVIVGIDATISYAPRSAMAPCGRATPS